MLIKNYTIDYAQKIKARLSTWPYRYFAFVAIALYFVAGGLTLVRYSGNPTALFHFGHLYIKQNPGLTPPGSIRFIGNENHGGNGYDGQIFFYYSASLLQKDKWPQGFSKAYRAPRIGLPLLVAPFHLFGLWGGVFGFYLVQMSLILLSALCLYKILKPKNRYLLIFFLASPFMLRSTLLMVSDITALCLALIGYFFWLKLESPKKKTTTSPHPFSFPLFLWNRPLVFFILSLLFFSLAIFAKESALFFLFPLGLWALFGYEPASHENLETQTNKNAPGEKDSAKTEKGKKTNKNPYPTKQSSKSILFSLKGTSKNGANQEPDCSQSVRRAPSNMKTPPKRTIIRGALNKIQLKRASVLLLSLLPMLAWQYYLQKTHGMIPANILKIFVSPFQGILGVGFEVFGILKDSPSTKTAIFLLAKALARVLLVFLLATGLLTALRGPFRQGWPFRLAALLTALSIIFADHFYFWGIFDNIARMFAIFLPALILLSDAASESENKTAADKQSTWRTQNTGLLFFLGSLFLTLLLLLRSAFVSPSFPFNTWRPYKGPSYLLSPASPYCQKNTALKPKICTN